MTHSHTCRHCGATLQYEVIDLGHQPASNSYLTYEDLSNPETTFPLKVYLCTSCWLMQLPAHQSASDLFTPDYAYFSSTSTSWVDHSKRYVTSAINRLSLNSKSFVVEIASNDGYLLQHFLVDNIPCLGIEPTAATAAAAREKGIETIEEFFGFSLACELKKADLIIANNVLAHVPDINDFASGIASLLKSDAQASIEFPHLLNLIRYSQFDTIYHEHYSYLSLSTVERIFTSVGLEVIEVEKLTTHGGSLRVWVAHKDKFIKHESVSITLQEESDFGLESVETYQGFQNSAELVKYNLLKFLIESKLKSKKVLAYGAAAKGNTLLNYCGIMPDLLSAVADNAISKQGKYLPHSHIPIISPRALELKSPDYVLVLPWNLISELTGQLSDYSLVTALPKLRFISN